MLHDLSSMQDASRIGQEMQEEAAEVHEEVPEAVQAGRQEEKAVREDLLRARLLAYSLQHNRRILSDLPMWHTFAAPARRSCA